MGPGFVILFWLFLAAIFAVLWASSFGMFVVGWRKKKTWLAVLGGVPLLGLTVIGLLLLTLFAVGMIAGSNPRSVYTAAFGQKPSPDVKNLQSKTWGFADEGHTFLQFQASYQTFQRIRRKELPQASFEEYRQTLLAQPGRTPKWWTVPTASTTEVYLLNSEFGKGKSFATETILMACDTIPAPCNTTSSELIDVVLARTLAHLIASWRARSADPGVFCRHIVTC